MAEQTAVLLQNVFHYITYSYYCYYTLHLIPLYIFFLI